MTKELKIMALDNRIALLRSRGELVNVNIIHKLERRKRKLMASN